MLNNLKWWVKRRFFMFVEVRIKKNSKEGARVKWSYKMFDVATLREFPETQKYQLPSNSRNRGDKPAALP